MSETVSVLITGPCQAFPDQPVVYTITVLPGALPDTTEALARADDLARLAWAEAPDLDAAQTQAATWVTQYGARLVLAVQPVAAIRIGDMGGWAVVALVNAAGGTLAAFTALTPDEITTRVAALAEQFPAAEGPPALPAPSAPRRVVLGQLAITQAAHDAPRRVVLGQLAITQAAHDALQRSRKDARMFLQRHVRGDWGDLSPADAQANDHALRHGGRLLSAYTLTSGETLWIITEDDRSRTTLLLPSDY